MKTIKQIAEICGCSKTTVSRAIKDLELEPIVEKNRHLYEDEAVNEIITAIMHNDAVCGENETETQHDAPKPPQPPQNTQQTATNEISIERQMIEVLQEQIKIKDKLIDDLSKKLDKQMDLNAFKTQQIALLTANDDAEKQKDPQPPQQEEKKKEEAEAQPQPQKKGIFRFFRK